MGSIRRDGLPRTRTSQQTSEYAQCLQIRYDLLHPHRSDMHLREGGSHIGVSLIGTNHDLARRGDGEVSARHRHVGMEEFLTQILTGGMRQVGRVDIPFLRSHLTLHHLADLLPFDMDRRHHDMAPGQMHQLQDTLTQIALHHIDSFRHQELIHMAFLRQHRFALDQVPGIMLAQDPQDDLVMLLGIFRPMHDSPVGDRVFLELLQKRVQMAVGVKLDLRGQLPQPFPLGKRMAHLIPFGTYHPKRMVVPSLILLIL